MICLLTLALLDLVSLSVITKGLVNERRRLTVCHACHHYLVI